MQDSRTHVGNEAQRGRERSKPLAGTVDLPLVRGRAAAAKWDRAAVEAEEARELAPEEYVGERDVVSLAPGLGHLVGDFREGGAPDFFPRAFAEPR